MGGTAVVAPLNVASNIISFGALVFLLVVPVAFGARAFFKWLSR